MRPELPFLAAGAIAITGGVIKEGKWPASTPNALIGTVVLTVVASASANSRVAPLVRAVGILLVITSLMAAVKAIESKKKGK